MNGRQASERTGAAAEYSPQQVALAEQVLGVPLQPEGIEAPLEPDTIRGYACATVQGAVRRLAHLEGVPPDELELTPDRLEKLRTNPAVGTLPARLAVANSALHSWHNPPPMPEAYDTSNAKRTRFQGAAITNLVGHTQRVPSYYDEPDRRHPYREGYLTVAPPGAGKTLLQGLLVNYLGVGLPVSETELEPRLAVGIVNSQILIRQGTDPSGDLVRYANAGRRPGQEIRIGANFQGRHDGHDEYHWILTTPKSYAEAVRSRAIDTDRTVCYALDEAHRTAMAPSMQGHVTQFSTGLFMFTATPAIAGGERDLRRQFPHSQFGTLRSFIEDGILSPLKLYSYRAPQHAGGNTELAINIAADYLAKGLKTLIVCQPGDQLNQAQVIRDAVNHLYRKGAITPGPGLNWQGGDEIACAIGKFPGSRTGQDIMRLKQNKLLLATTVATANEGLDMPDLKGLIVIGPQGQDASWRLEQWLGRVLRLNAAFPLAVASEIVPATLPTGRPLASIFGPFVQPRERIVSGMYIGPLEEDELPPQAQHEQTPAATEPTPIPLPPADLGPEAATALDSADGPASPSDSAAQSDESAPPAATETPEGAESEEPGAATQPPAEENAGRYLPHATLIGSLVTDISYREATIAPTDLAKLPPAEYQPVEGRTPEGVPVEWLYTILDKITAYEDELVRYVGVPVPTQDGGSRYVRYYSPAAHRYLDAHPMPELVQEGELSDEGIAQLFLVTRRHVRELIEGMGIQRLDRITRYHRSPNVYGIEDVIRLGQEISKTPIADSTDVVAADLADELGKDYASGYLSNPTNGITAINKRRNPMHGIVGCARHITAEEADAIREAYRRLAVADPTKVISYVEIAERAGISRTTVTNKLGQLAPEQRPTEQWLRSAPGKRGGLYVDRAWGEAFADYIKPYKLMPWQATLDMIAGFFGKEKLNMGNILTRRGIEAEKLPLPGVSEEAIYPITVIDRLLDEGMEPQVAEVDLSRAATGPEHSKRDKRIEYSQRLQRLFVDEAKLATSEDLREYRQNHGQRVLPPPPPEPKPQPAATASAEAEPPASPDDPAPTAAPQPQPAGETAGSSTDADDPYQDSRKWHDPTAIPFLKAYAEPYAFRMLLQVAKLPDKELMRDDTTIIGIHEEGLKKLKQCDKSINSAPSGWTRLENIQRFGNFSSTQEVMKHVQVLAASMKRPLANGEEYCLGRRGDKVELYFAPRVSVALINKLPRLLPVQR